ncbi:MAG TPA: WS/DGAT domain-containing protein, partial [Terriglobales bacterium]
LTAHSEILRMAQGFATGKGYSSGFGNGNGNGTQAASPLGIAANPLSALAPIGELAKLLTELAQPVQKLPFNTLCRGPQIFDWTEIPIADLIQIKEAGEATLNEVVLAIMSGALRRYAELHSLSAKGRSLRIVIPVNIRAAEEDAGVGNRITFLPVDIPVSTHDARKLLEIVKERVAFGRAAHGAELVGLIGMLLGTMPTPLQTLFCQILRQLPISLLNTICTNVPGPRNALYLMGHKLLSAYPYVPIGGEIGMNCAVLSYNGTLFVGFTGDAPAIPDIAKLAESFQESFVDLRNAMLAPLPEKKKGEPKRFTKKVARKETRAVQGRVKVRAKKKAEKEPELEPQPLAVEVIESTIAPEEVETSETAAVAVA